MNVWFPIVPTPVPGIAKPKRRQQMQCGRLRPAVRHGGSDQNIVRRRFRVLDLDIEEISIECACVPKFELAFHL